MFSGLESLKRSRNSDYSENSYLIKKFYPEKKEMYLNINKLNLGLRMKDRKPFYISMDSPWRIILLGKTRIGKTMIIRRIIDMAYLNDYSSIFIDVKDEMKSSRLPCTDADLLKLLPENDKPITLKMKVFRPLFFSKYIEEKEPPEGNEWFAIPYKWLSFNELLTILGYTSDNESTRKYKNILEENFKKFETLTEFIEFFEDKEGKNKDINPTTKKVLARALRLLQEYKIFTDEPVGDFYTALKERNVVVFNFREHNIINKTIAQVYLMILQRLVRNFKRKDKERQEKRQNRLLPKRTIWIIDEAADFLVQKSIAHQELREAVRRDASLGIYMIFGIQELQSTPDFILKQCRYVLFPCKSNLNDIIKIKEQVLQEKIWHAGWQGDLGRILQKMKKRNELGLRDWGVIDADADDKDKKMMIVGMYPSLSYHMPSDI